MESEERRGKGKEGGDRRRERRKIEGERLDPGENGKEIWRRRGLRRRGMVKLQREND